MRKPAELLGRCSGTFAILGLALAGCAPGYMNAADLDRRGQGPSACSRSCEDIGLRMVAMVLVSDQLPGCVCQVVEERKAPSPAPAPAPGPAPAPSPAPLPAPATEPAAEGVNSTSSTAPLGFVVVAASVAREKQRQEEQDRAQKGN